MIFKFQTLFIVVVTHILSASSTAIDEEIELSQYNLTLVGISHEFDEEVNYQFFPTASVTAIIAIIKYLENHTDEEYNENLSGRLWEIRSSQYGKATIDNIIYITNEKLEEKTELFDYISEKYKCETNGVDFKNESEDIQNSVNEWISQHTDGRIDELRLLPYPSTTEFIWIESSIFNFDWRSKFSRYSIRTGDFYFYGKTIEVVYMSRQKITQYYEDPSNKFRAIGLPLKGNEFSIYIILPEEEETLDSLLLDKLNAEEFIKISNSTRIPVNYQIPKLKLKQVGIQSDFFFNYLGASNLQSGFNLQGVLELEIHESGISAVQAYSYYEASPESPPSIDKFETKDFSKTGVAGVKQGSGMFVVDRPFLFYIQHINTKLIVFSGFVNNPETNPQRN